MVDHKHDTSQSISPEKKELFVAHFLFLVVQDYKSLTNLNRIQEIEKIAKDVGIPVRQAWQIVAEVSLDLIAEKLKSKGS